MKMSFGFPIFYLGPLFHKSNYDVKRGLCTFIYFFLGGSILQDTAILSCHGMAVYYSFHRRKSEVRIKKACWSMR